MPAAGGCLAALRPPPQRTGERWRAESVQRVPDSKRMDGANLVLALAARRGLP